jgi:hypothetical protein
MIRNKLIKIIKRIDRSLNGPANNFSEQFMYGHREILIAYAGIKANMAIKGSIEHGWSPFGPNLGVPKRPGRRFIHLAWSSINITRFNHKYPSSVIPIGAPFLYLCQLFNESKSLALTNNREFLFIPTHGSETDSPKIYNLINVYSKKYNPLNTTVQLYWTEFLKKEIRDAYLSKGFHVVTAGFSGMSATEGLGIAVRERAMSTIGDRHLFLLRILANLSTHNEIIFGGFGTSTLYAGFLDKKVSLLSNWDSSDTVIFDDALTTTGNDYNDFIREKILPNFFDNNLMAKSNFKEFCDSELGCSEMMAKKDLAQLICDNYFLINSHAPVNELLSVVSKGIN